MTPAQRNGGARALWVPLARALLIGLGAAAGAVVLFGIADAGLTGDNVHAGVATGEVAIGGLSRAGAGDVLRKRLEPSSDRPVYLTHKGRRWRVAPSQFAASIDYDATTRQAWRVGRAGGFAVNLATRLMLWLRPRSVDVVVTADRDRVDAFIARLRRQWDVPPISAGLETSGTAVLRTRARSGLMVRPVATRRTLLVAMAAAKSRSARLPVWVVAARVSDDAVEPAYRDATTMVARPLYLRYGQKTWRISREKIGSWIVFERRMQRSEAAGSQIVLGASLSRGRVASTVSSLTRSVHVAPRDASFQVVGERVRIVPSKTGAGIDSARAYTAILGKVRSPGYRLVKLVKGPLKPRLTTAWARASGIKTLIGTYTTRYDPGATSRVSNIHLLLRQLNNTYVPPGAAFSFNKTIGPRTAERGYQQAPAIVGGRLVPSLGGGVCQVGTTLFNAVFFGGLEVVERHNHSFYISHYPAGRDATVAWGGPDLRFRNDTPAWVLVKAWWGEDWVTISLYGASVGNEVSYETGEFHNFVEAPMERVRDPDMVADRTEIEDEGIRGRDIAVRRTVRRWGKVIHQDVFESHYLPKAGIVRVGTKPAPKAKTPRSSRETTRTSR